MDDRSLSEQIHNLSDLELANLLCLIADQHCIINTDEEFLDTLAHELQLVCINCNTFAQG